MAVRNSLQLPELSDEYRKTLIDGRHSLIAYVDDYKLLFVVCDSFIRLFNLTKDSYKVISN